jgi:hypothetical protein
VSGVAGASRAELRLDDTQEVWALS